MRNCYVTVIIFKMFLLAASDILKGFPELMWKYFRCIPFEGWVFTNIDIGNQFCEFALLLCYRLSKFVFDV